MNKVELSPGAGDLGGKVVIDGEEVHPTKVIVIMEAGKLPEVRMTFYASELTAVLEKCTITVAGEENP